MAGIHSLSGEVDPVGRGSQSTPQDSFNFSADRHSVKQDILSPCFYFGRHPISCPRRERGKKKEASLISDTVMNHELTVAVCGNEL